MLCLLTATGGVIASLAVSSLTLSWQHSVEKVEWQEDWQVVAGRLVVTQARIRGSGAGMEPPEGSRLADGWWQYRPALPPLEQLVLSRSHHAEDYRLCWNGTCRPLAELAPLPDEAGVTLLRPCGE